MGKKLSTLTAGVVTAAVSAAAIAPSAFAYIGQNNEVTPIFDPAKGNVEVATEYHSTSLKKAGTATLTITPAEDYACESVAASYQYKGSTYDIEGVSCEETTFELPAFLSFTSAYPDVDVVVEFALANYYIITENPEWTVGSEEDLVITGNGAYDDFYRVLVDGGELDPVNYDVTEGSTEVALHAAYLSTLRDGEHAFAIEWNEGENAAGTTFAIVTETPAPTPTPTPEPTPEEKKEEVKEEKKVAPDTGVTSAVAFAGIATALTLGGAIVALKAKKNA